MSASAGRYVYLGQCDRLRRGSPSGEQAWQAMMAEARPVSRAQLLAHVDLAPVLDEGELPGEWLAGLGDPRFFRSTWAGCDAFFVQAAGFEFIFVDPSCAGDRKENPNMGMSLRLALWRKPPLWDAESIEVEAGDIPPAAFLLAAMHDSVVLPVRARVAGQRKPVRAGILIEARPHDAGVVDALLSRDPPELSAAPSGHKWYSWQDAAPALLSILVENGTRAVGPEDAIEVELYVDPHLPRPPHHQVSFRAWTVQLEKKSKRSG
jgi:hypothetical protein